LRGVAVEDGCGCLGVRDDGAEREPRRGVARVGQDVAACLAVAVGVGASVGERSGKDERDRCAAGKDERELHG